MKYELYIDAFFLLNFFMDTLLLFLLRKVLKCTATHGRLIMGGALGAGMACIITVMPIAWIWIKLFVGYTAVSICMVKFTFRQMNLLQAYRASIYLYGLAFLLGGVLYFVSAQVPVFAKYGTGLWGVCGIALLFYGAISLLLEKRKKKGKEHLLSVTVVWEDREIQLVALADTGNSLYEPISGRPVSILEKNATATLFQEKRPERFRAIPFHSIGKTHGILEGYELTELRIAGEHEKIKIAKPMVGLFDGKLSTAGEYQMILHPTLTRNQEESV